VRDVGSIWDVGSVWDVGSIDRRPGCRAHSCISVLAQKVRIFRGPFSLGSELVQHRDGSPVLRLLYIFCITEAKSVKGSKNNFGVQLGRSIPHLDGFQKRLYGKKAFMAAMRNGASSIFNSV